MNIILINKILKNYFLNGEITIAEMFYRINSSLNTSMEKVQVKTLFVNSNLESFNKCYPAKKLR